MEHGPNMTASPDDLAQLIRKLRWIGLEDDERQLQRAMLSLPRGQRGIVLAGPFDTD